MVDDVDYMLGHHVLTGHALGDLVPGMDGYAATDKFDAHFAGRTAHAGSGPHLGRNALLAACTATLNLYAIARHGEGATRVNVGRLQAGSARNAIPEGALLAIETRGATDVLAEYMREQAMRVLEAAASMHGCQLSVRAMGSARCAKADAPLVGRVEEVARGLGISGVRPQAASGGSEDYTYMMRRVQERGGLATNIGVGAAPTGSLEVPRAHTPRFDLNEEAMRLALELLAVLTISLQAQPVPRA
jgi:aminobenzoyl-glutamate utilization protein A